MMAFLLCLLLVFMPSGKLVEAGKKKLVEGDMAIPMPSSGSSDVAFAFRTDTNLLWEGGIVPFTFKDGEWVSEDGEMYTEPYFTDEDMQLIRDAMQHISDSVPCLQFRETLNSSNVAKLIFQTQGDTNVASNSCFSYVGKRGNVGGENGQTINLVGDCLNMGTVVHELMHSLGATHEQSRPDRDQHITILWDNIDPDHISDFDKKELSTFNSRNTSYDTKSLMHYNMDAFSTNGENTMKLKDSTKTVRPLEKRTGLSVIDTLELARVYDDITPPGVSCFTNTMAYVDMLEKELANLKETFNKDMLLFVGPGKILQVPSFTLATGCSVPSYPISGLAYAVTGVVDNKIMTCGETNIAVFMQRKK